MRQGFTLLAYAAAFAACAFLFAACGYADPLAGLAALLVGGMPFAVVLVGRGAGGDHLRTCTASFGCSSACRANRTSSIPSTTCIAMRDDTTSTVRTPSTAFDDSVVRDDSCKQVPCASCNGSTGSNCFEFFSSMAAIFRIALHRNNLQTRDDRI